MHLSEQENQTKNKMCMINDLMIMRYPIINKMTSHKLLKRSFYRFFSCRSNVLNEKTTTSEYIICISIVNKPYKHRLNEIEQVPATRSLTHIHAMSSEECLFNKILYTVICKIVTHPLFLLTLRIFVGRFICVCSCFVCFFLFAFVRPEPQTKKGNEKRIMYFAIYLSIPIEG